MSTLFTIPFSRDDHFVGREEVIADIHSKRAAMPNHSRIALVGLGGVGKSQVAIEYAYRIRQVEPHTMVFWIHASNSARFEQGYREVADKIALPGRENPQADILQLVHAWLSDAKNGQWLLILDNVDDDNIFFADEQAPTYALQANSLTGDLLSSRRPLESFLPQRPHRAILITSRNRTAAINLIGTQGSIVSVEPMEEADALALLKTRVPFDENGQADAKALVQALECIPLAITHAAAYVQTRAQTTTLSSYLEMFRASEDNQKRLLSRKEWKDLRRDYSTRHAVITTWQISFTQIRNTKRTAADLLALMSMFDKQGIPRSLVESDMDPVDFEDALAPLVSFSLVRVEVGKQTVGMHQLVQLSMRTCLEMEGQLGQWIQKSIDKLDAAFPSGDYETWGECQLLLPHSREVVGHKTEERDCLLTRARTAKKIGWYLLLRGEFESAEGILRMSAEVREKVLGAEHPNTLVSVNLVGVVLERQGNYDKAEAMHRRALHGRERVLGAEHPDTLTSVSQLGMVLERQGKYEVAEAMHRRALQGREKVLGAEHPNTVTSKGNLTLVLKGQRRRNEAKDVEEWVLSARKRLFGNEHPHTLTSIANLAHTLRSLGQKQEALSLMRTCCRLRELKLGPQHPHTKDSLKKLRKWEADSNK